ncbi:hypothetical protein AAH678_28410 [Sodalis endosymbiont of Spalangia cameroni]|uniref:hypothetical protein n=1 Tax=Sodalis praecaptivus TaxID=1239307 RepID=UPI0031F7D0CA
MSNRDWRAGQFSASQLNRNGFYVEKTSLNAAYTEKGRQIKSVEFRVIGQVDTFLQAFTLYGLTAEKTSANSHYHTVMLIPPG